MSEGYSGRVWACPFFHWDEKKKVHCEGGGVSFQRKGTFVEYADRFCGQVNGWEKCTIARALIEQYEKERE